MIGDVRLTNEVLGTVKGTFFCLYVVQCGPLVNVAKYIFSFLPGVCVKSQVSAKYALERYFHPLFTWRQF